MPPYLNTAPNKVSARHTGFAKWLGQRAAGVRQLHIKQGTLSDGGGCGSCCFLSSCFHSLEDAKDDGPVLSVSTELNSFLQSVQCCRFLGKMLTWEAFVTVHPHQTESLSRLSTLRSLTSLVIGDDPDKLGVYDLTALAELHRLHTLMLPTFSGLHNRADNFSALQCLQLKYCCEPRCDLSIYTQLTHLKLYDLMTRLTVSSCPLVTVWHCSSWSCQGAVLDCTGLTTISLIWHLS
ncbi:TPA: hypothetical protein ACH3X2_011779 [Trebouxia sp. C0005]